MNKTIYLLACLLVTTGLLAQADVFTDIAETEVQLARPNAERAITPTVYKTLALDEVLLQQLLKSAPGEGASVSSVTLDVPLATGKVESFRLVEYSMMEPGLADQFPSFKTYRGVGVNDATRRIRLDWTATGFNAMLYLPEGLAIVRPYAKGDTEHYLSYFERDVPPPTEPWVCGTVDDKELVLPEGEQHARVNAGDCQLRQYRLAVAVTGEFATSTLGASSAGTPADDAIVNSHIVTSINQINGWYERDFSARLVLIANQTSIYYYDGASDPYTNSSSSTMLNENRDNLNAVIGQTNYELGHVLGNGGGSSGVAQLNALCSTNQARGVTKASASGIAQPRYLKVFAHEMGHQFGCGHTQNENCQRSSTSAMEPGAGTTIMSYVTSACANQIQSVPDYYFHAISIQQASTRMLSTTCATILPSANNQPSVSAGSNKTVPHSTPLLLTATGSDPDGDALTYVWEQYDNEAATTIPPQPTNTLGPQFRSFPPSPEPGRYLPNLQAVVDGVTPTWEVLPSVARTMDFRVTVRDNSSNGISCTDEDDVTITVDDDGPFAVTSPSGAATVWFETETRTVTWDAANTANAPVSCANVDILLSRDGGLTYPETLATQVANSGSASVVVPTGPTTSARVLVRCSDNVFYNISTEDFEIAPATAPTFTLTLNPASVSVCAGQSAPVNVSTSPVLGFSGNITLSVSGLPGATTAGFNNTIIPVGSGTVLTLTPDVNLAPGNYNLTVDGTSGPLSQSAALTLVVLEPAGDVTLQAPADGAVDLPLTPTLEWNPKANASGYDVQVATDPSFNTLVSNVTVAAASYQQSPALTPETTYYWRVRATTSCGQTPWSVTRDFDTGNCLAPVQQPTAVPITSSGTPVVTSTIAIAQTGDITSLVIPEIIMDHTYMSDLEVTLIAPGGSPSAVLWSRLCGSSDNADLGLSDAAATDVASAPCTPLGQGGMYRPDDPLSVFNGLSANGNWTLEIQDLANLDGGQLTSWSLEICTEASGPLPVELLNFEATARERDIELQWTTANEQGNAGFEIERRSATEPKFVTVAKANPSDSPSDVSAYAVYDTEVRPGVQYYYRLRQLDLDGSESFSDIRAAKLDAESSGELTLMPNPARSEVLINLTADLTTATTLRLYDMRGRMLVERQSIGTQTQLDLRSLSAGVYIVEVTDATDRRSARLVVE